MTIGTGGYIPIGFNSTTYIKTIFNYNIDPTQIKVIVFEDVNADGRYDQGEPILTTEDFPLEINISFWRTVELEPIMFFDSIQAAISAAISGQAIYLYNGIYGRKLGDVTGDSKVDILDLEALSRSYGSTPQSPNWNPNCDFNSDNIIDVFDLQMLARNYGKSV